MIAQTILITQENIDWYIENYVEGTQNIIGMIIGENG